MVGDDTFGESTEENMSGILQPIEVVSSMSTTTNTRFTFNFKGAISKNWPSSSKQTSLTTSCSCR